MVTYGKTERGRKKLERVGEAMEIGRSKRGLEKLERERERERENINVLT